MAGLYQFDRRTPRTTISNYLEELRKNDRKKENLLNRDAGDLRRDESAFNSVIITWQISFKHISEERASAADLGVVFRAGLGCSLANC